MSFGARLRSKREERDVEVFAKDGRLHVDGVAVPFLYAYATVRNTEPDEPNVVRVVDADLRPVFDLAVPRSSDADKLITKLGVDDLARPIELRAGRVNISSLVGVILFSLTLLPAVFVGVVAERKELFYVVLALAVAAVIAIYRLPRRTVLVHERGIEVRELGRATRVEWVDLELVERYADDGVLLRRYAVRHDDGRPAFADPEQNKGGFVSTAVPQENLILQKVGSDAREALYRLLLTRRAAANRAVESSSSLAPAPVSTRDDDVRKRLAACGVDDSAWWDALASLVPRESYRDPTPSDEVLALVVRDVDAPLRERISASLVLLRRDASRPPLFITPDLPVEVKTTIDALNAGFPDVFDRRTEVARLGALLRSASSA